MDLTTNSIGDYMNKLVVREIVGLKFNRLTIIKNLNKSDKNGKRLYLVKCDCGTEKILNRNSIVSNITKSCGCLRIESSRKRTRRDLTGFKFGKLTAIKMVGLNKTKRCLWECVCDCGNIKIIDSHNLIEGGTKSCGCSRYTAHLKVLKRFPGKLRYINNLIKTYEIGAKSRSIPFNLTWEEAKNIIIKKCHYCGILRERKVIKVIVKLSGIDRLNSNIGYNIKNCVPSCKFCNYAKNTLGQKEFLRLIKQIYNYRIKGNKN